MKRVLCLALGLSLLTAEGWAQNAPLNPAAFPVTRHPGEFQFIAFDYATIPAKVTITVDGVDVTDVLTPSCFGHDGTNTCFVDPIPAAVEAVIDVAGRHEVTLKVTDPTTGTTGSPSSPTVVYTISTNCIYILNGVSSTRPIGYSITGKIPFTKGTDTNYGTNRIAELRAGGWRVDAWLLDATQLQASIKCTGMAQ